MIFPSKPETIKDLDSSISWTQKLFDSSTLSSTEFPEAAFPKKQKTQQKLH